jgi:hypothetical protein
MRVSGHSMQLLPGYRRGQQVLLLGLGQFNRSHQLS